MKFNFKELIKGILVICSYFILQIIFMMPFIFLLEKNMISEYIVYLFVFGGLTTVYLIAYRKSLLEDIKDFKKNYKKILSITIKYWLMGLIIMIISSLIIAYIGIGNSNNQNTNIELFKKAPIIQGFLSITLAPIIEELVFRRSFKNFTDNKILFALTTGLIFGGIHVLSSLSNLNDLKMLIHIIPYSSVGIAFGLAYKEHNNILGTIITHSFHNIIAILEILFLL